MPVVDLPHTWRILLDFVVWAVVHVSAAYLTWRMPLDRFENNGTLYRERGWERHGRLYVNVLRVKRWKHLLPDGAAWFQGGFTKRRLRDASAVYLERFQKETRRAELTHWLAMLPAPVFFLWNAWPVGLVMIVYALIANLPCIIVQRYNRIRLCRVLR